MAEQLNEHRVPPLVWILIAGEGFASTFRFMVMPFLALYMHVVTGASPALVGVVIGVSPVTGIISSFYLGPLSDRIGRKPAVVVGTLGLAISLVGFGIAHSLIAFAAMQVLMGLSGSLQGPASDALIMDYTPEDRRTRIFGFNYWAVNFGAAIGPVVGSLIGSGHAALPFILFAGAQLVLVIATAVLVPKDGARLQADGSARESLRHMREGLSNPVFLWAFLGMFLTWLGYSQIESNVAQFLGVAYHDGAHIFAFMLSANAVTVVILQPLITRWLERRSLRTGFVLGSAIYAVANASFILASVPAAWITITVIFTLGEMLLGPIQWTMIADYAPEDRRATYFTLQKIVTKSFAFGIGPLLGGTVLSALGKTGLFGAMSFVDVVAVGAFAAAFSQRTLRKGERVMAE